MESGEDVVVGVNKFTESEPNPLVGGVDGGILTVDPAVEAAAIEARRDVAGRARRRSDVDDALTALRDAAKTDANLMAAVAGSAPGSASPSANGPACCARCSASTGRRPESPARRGGGHAAGLAGVHARVRAASASSWAAR